MVLGLVFAYWPCRIVCRVLQLHNATCVGRVDHPALAGAGIWSGRPGRWIGPRQRPPMIGPPAPHLRVVRLGSRR